MAAKRHHYVPRMLLRRFSPQPEIKNAPLWRVGKHRGAPQRTNIDNEAVIGQYYKTETPLKGVPYADVEAFLAALEGKASVAIDKMVGQQPLTAGDRRWFSAFVVIQHRRTPLAREQTLAFMTEAAKWATIVSLAKGEEVARAHLEKREGRKVSDAEVSAYIRELQADLEAGRVKVLPKPDHEVFGVFQGAPEVGQLIDRRMTWYVLRAPAGASFVLADHPVVMVQPEAPGAAVGWMTPGVEVHLPLSSAVCIAFDLGPAAVEYRTVDTQPLSTPSTYAATRVPNGPFMGRTSRPSKNCGGMSRPTQGALQLWHRPDPVL